MILWQLFNFRNKNPKKEIEEFLPHAKKPKPLSSLFNKTLWEWADLLIVPLILGAITILWNYRVEQQSIYDNQGQIVRNYIDSITGLILDQYHHGKIDKFPEISEQEVKGFIRAKTANTLQALNPAKHSPYHPGVWLENLIKWTALSPPENTPKQNLINFLREAGIGFLPPYKSEEYDSKLLIQNICLNGDMNAKNYMVSEEKDITFDGLFCNINLSSVVLNNLNLKAVIWERANLTNAEMRRTNLEQADFQGAWLNQVDLTGANLNKANLKGAYLQETTLNKTILTLANLRGAILATPKLQEGASHPTNLEDADLRGVNLRGADLQGVNFKNATMKPFCVTKKPYNQDQKGEEVICEREIITNLRNATLQSANLTNTNLRKANLRGANLQKTNIRQAATLEGAIFDDKTQFPEPIEKLDKFIKDNNMIKIYPDLDKDQYTNKESKILDLSDMDLRGAELKNAHLSGVDLSRADLRGADMSNANLEGATLKDALYDDNTELPSNDFGSDQKAKDAQAKIRGMIKIVPGANLEEKDIRYADLSGVDLSNTKLQGAKLSSIDFDHETDWTDAEFDLDTKLPFDRNTAIRYGMRFKPSRDLDVSYVKQLPFSLQVLVIDSHQKYKQKLPINWEGENHQKANLQNAILREGNFKYAVLKQAKLQKADLTGADLTGANLIGANLRQANLTGVTLKGADLTDANLIGVVVVPDEARKHFEKQLEEAVLCRTALPNDVSEQLKKDAKDRDCAK